MAFVMSVIVVAPIFQLLLPPRLNFSPQNAERYLYYRRSPRQIPSGKKLKDYEDILAGNEIIKRPSFVASRRTLYHPFSHFLPFGSSFISFLVFLLPSLSFFLFFVFLFFPFFFVFVLFQPVPSAFPRSRNSRVLVAVENKIFALGDELGFERERSFYGLARGRR